MQLIVLPNACFLHDNITDDWKLQDVELSLYPETTSNEKFIVYHDVQC
jgi:hypothetical protein